MEVIFTMHDEKIAKIISEIDSRINFFVERTREKNDEISNSMLTELHRLRFFIEEKVLM